MMTLIRCFLRDDRGATAIEYGLIALGISTAIIGALATVVVAVETMYTEVSEKVGEALP